ncbi:MAG: helix-turn-helix domain-containing protein [Pseudoclavibacter sp.]
MRQHRSKCPINIAVEVLGDSWTMIVLRDLVLAGRRHFSELLHGCPEGIASNILASRLKRLVDAGLLTRESSARGAKARYSLTEAGIRTVPVLVALGTWGLDTADCDPEVGWRSEALRLGGPEFAERLMAELRELHLHDGDPAQAPDSAIRALQQR